MAPSKMAAAHNYLPTQLVEKPSLDPPRKPSRLLSLLKVATIGVLGACYFFSDELLNLLPGQHAVSVSASAPELCPQVKPIAPSAQDSLVEVLDEYLLSTEGSEWAIESLAGAVRVPSVLHCITYPHDVLNLPKHANV